MRFTENTVVFSTTNKKDTNQMRSRTVWWCCTAPSWLAPTCSSTQCRRAHCSWSCGRSTLGKMEELLRKLHWVTKDLRILGNRSPAWDRVHLTVLHRLFSNVPGIDNALHYAAGAMGALSLRISELFLSFSPHPNTSDGNFNLVHHFFASKYSR